MKKIHWYRPHVFTCQNGRQIHRLTKCAVALSRITAAIANSRERSPWSASYVSDQLKAHMSLCDALELAVNAIEALSLPWEQDNARELADTTQNRKDFVREILSDIADKLEGSDLQS